MKNFLELAKARHSVRKFQNRAVEEKDLEYILEAGRIAPSAANYQPWHFIVVQDKEIKKELDTTYSRDWFRQAPVVIVICGDHRQGWKRSDGKDHTDIDAAITTDHMTLAAADIGLGTCWVCNFDAKKAAAILGLPGTIEPIAYLPVGYPEEEKTSPAHFERKTMQEVVHRDTFRNH